MTSATSLLRSNRGEPSPASSLAPSKALPREWLHGRRWPIPRPLPLVPTAATSASPRAAARLGRRGGGAAVGVALGDAVVARPAARRAPGDLRRLLPRRRRRRFPELRVHAAHLCASASTWASARRTPRSTFYVETVGLSPLECLSTRGSPRLATWRRRSAGSRRRPPPTSRPPARPRGGRRRRPHAAAAAPGDGAARRQSWEGRQARMLWRKRMAAARRTAGARAPPPSPPPPCCRAWRRCGDGLRSVLRDILPRRWIGSLTDKTRTRRRSASWRGRSSRTLSPCGAQPHGSVPRRRARADDPPSCACSPRTFDGALVPERGDGDGPLR